MSEFVYQDYIPANARVIVDYTSKDRVKFSYPTKMSYWQAVRRCAYPTVLSFWLMLHIFWLRYLIPAFIAGGVGYLAYVSFFPYSTIINESVKYNNLMTVTFPILCGFVWFLVLPAIFTLWLALDKDRLGKWVPKMGYWAAYLAGTLKLATFTKENINDNKAIIPNFGNIFLEYEAKGDFNTYLEKIEIMEIPFEFWETSIINPFNTKKRTNEAEFRAVFFFYDTPKDGCLDVKFI